MAVPKIAVIALVAIIAVPILLGYAMNLEKVTETTYKVDGESVNVTQLLQNDVGYSYSHADIYQINSNNFTNSMSGKMYPVYKTITSAKTPLEINQDLDTPTSSLYADLWNFYFFNFTVPNSDYSNYVSETIYTVDENNVATQIAVHDRVIDSSYDDSTKTLTVTFIHSYGVTGVAYYTNNRLRISCADVGTPLSNNIFNYSHKTFNLGINYADFAAGYTLIHHDQLTNDPVQPRFAYVGLPDNTRSALMTIDLNSITDPNYSIDINGYTLVKTTTLGVVSWSVYETANPSNTADLYYDPTRISNSYQMYVNVAKIGNITPGYTEYAKHTEFRYVGDWPVLVGKANVFLTYSFDTQVSSPDVDPLMKNITISGASVTPLIRMDDAEFRAFTMPIIENYEYIPANFRNNPSTTISNVSLYGQSLSFGGNTYTVTDGNIRIGSKNIPVNNIVLDSVHTDLGYDNRINGTVVSTTPTPAVINFNGTWSASVSTIGQVQTTYDKTVWHVGSFGWNGIDQNFLMVGLITCLGVFIALGIYARKKGSGGLIPLMIAVGCAAMVFFIML